MVHDVRRTSREALVTRHDVTPSKPLLRHGAIGVVTQVAAGAVAYGLALIVARASGAAGAGQVMWSLALLNVLSMVCRLGLDTSLVYFVSKWRADGRPGQALGLVRSSPVATSALGAVTAAAFFSFTAGSSDELMRVARIVVLALPAQVYVQQVGSVGQAHRRVSWLLLQRAVVPAGTVVGTALLWVSVGSPGPMTVAVVVVISAFAWAAFAAVALARLTVAEYGGVESVGGGAALRAASGYSMLTWPNAVLSYVFNNVDTLFLGLLASAFTTGVYNGAAKTAIFVSYILLGVNSAFAPHISRSHSAGDEDGLQRDYRFMVRWTMLGTMPIAAVMLLDGEHVLGIFGPEFRAGYLALAILTAGHLVNAAAGAVGLLLSMSGRQGRALAVNAGVFALVVAGYLVAIPRWGATGAAIVAAAGLAARNVIMLGLVDRLLSVRPSRAVALHLLVFALLVVAVRLTVPEVPALRSTVFSALYALWAATGLISRQEVANLRGALSGAAGRPR